MKFTPASAAESVMRCAVGSSVRSPNIIVPRQSSDTFNPLLPSLRYSMVESCVLTRGGGKQFILSRWRNIPFPCNAGEGRDGGNKAGCTGFYLTRYNAPLQVPICARI